MTTVHSHHPWEKPPPLRCVAQGDGHCTPTSAARLQGGPTAQVIGRGPDGDSINVGHGTGIPGSGTVRSWGSREHGVLSWEGSHRRESI